MRARFFRDPRSPRTASNEGQRGVARDVTNTHAMSAAVKVRDRRDATRATTTIDDDDDARARRAGATARRARRDGADGRDDGRGTSDRG